MTIPCNFSTELIEHENGQVRADVAFVEQTKLAHAAAAHILETGPELQNFVTYLLNVDRGGFEWAQLARAFRAHDSTTRAIAIEILKTELKAAIVEAILDERYIS